MDSMSEPPRFLPVPRCQHGRAQRLIHSCWQSRGAVPACRVLCFPRLGEGRGSEGPGLHRYGVFLIPQWSRAGPCMGSWRVPPPAQPLSPDTEHGGKAPGSPHSVSSLAMPPPGSSLQAPGPRGPSPCSLPASCTRLPSQEQTSIPRLTALAQRPGRVAWPHPRGPSVPPQKHAVPQILAAANTGGRECTAQLRAGSGSVLRVMPGGFGGPCRALSVDQ